MISRIVRPESWITEVLRINSHFGGINELEFGYSQLCLIARIFAKDFYKKEFRIKVWTEKNFLNQTGKRYF